MEIVTFVSISFIIWRCSAAGHVSGKRSWFKAWNTIDTHPSFHSKRLPLVLIHALKQLRCDPSGWRILNRRSICVDFEASVQMPFDLIGIPIFHQPIHHLEAYNLMCKWKKIIVYSNIKRFELIVKGMSLYTKHVILPRIFQLLSLIFPSADINRRAHISTSLFIISKSIRTCIPAFLMQQMVLHHK